MDTNDLLGAVVLTGLSLTMIKQMYPDKYEQERKRRWKNKPKVTTSAVRKKAYKVKMAKRKSKKASSKK
jgi:hypothetical protein